MNSLLEILFFATFVEATTRKLLQGVFYLYIIASLLDLVFCFCCQYWFLLARACHLVLKNIKLKVRVGNVVGFYFYHRWVFKQLLPESPRYWLNVFFAKFFSEDLSNSLALGIFEPTYVGATVNWNGCFKASTLRLNRRMGWLPLFFEVIFNYEAREVWNPEVMNIDESLLLCKVIKANGG